MASQRKSHQVSAAGPGFSFLAKNEFVIPLALFVAFLAVTLPGIAWGAPDIWHPDEVVRRSIDALHGDWQAFDETNYNHPALPPYMMYWLGRAVMAFGQAEREVLIAARVLSAVLTGLVIVMAYVITRRAGGNVYLAGLSGLFLVTASEMSHNGRFAHNDTFVTFFSTLAVLFILEYKLRDQRGWLYAAFFTIGLAASSKYNGISLIIVPVLVYLHTNRRELLNSPLRNFETLFLGGALAFLGYAVGTPRALLWMAYYLKRALTALIYNGNYGYQPDSLRGVLGQYTVFADGLGTAMFLLFITSAIWSGYKVAKAYRAKQNTEDPRAMLLLSILAIDLPIMLSYNFPMRFFLPLMPLFAVLSSLFIGDLYVRAKQTGTTLHPRLVLAGVAMILVLSFARVISVILLFSNDARIPASVFIKSLPTGTSLEHTEYPPSLPGEHFEREHNYPLFFQKAADQQLPVSNKYVFNDGEAGLDDRLTDYLVIDSFTADKFNDPYVCNAMQVECEFFAQLATGRSAHYRLLAGFEYSPPPFLPQIRIAFVNPEIRIYERIE